MNQVNTDFEKRVNEIELYFSFLEKNIVREAKLIYPDQTIEAFPIELNKIFKANCFLILYNLSESCIKNAIEAIYIHLNNEEVSFDSLRSSIKIEILKYLKAKVNPKNLVESIDNIAYDIIFKCFSTENIVSVDAKEIKKLARKYGFSSSILPISQPNGTLIEIDTEKVRTVKSNRNNLAHGIFSFAECGRNYTLQDLVKIKNHLIEYLRQILSHIENYVTNQDYLSTTS